MNRRLDQEVWEEFRPYLRVLLLDFCISVALWLLLFAFKLVTTFLAIDGWAGRLIIELHSSITVIAFVVFGILFTKHAWAISREHPPEPQETTSTR